jgi:hypothetical protein
VEAHACTHTDTKAGMFIHFFRIFLGRKVGYKYFSLDIVCPNGKKIRHLTGYEGSQVA